MLPALKKGQQNHFAVPCIDTFDMLSTEGVLVACEEKRAPIIIAIYAGGVDRPNAPGFAACVRALGHRTGVPVSIILDHGQSYEQCIKALTLGFTDIMFDGSKLPVEENIAITKLLVRAGHAVGAGVEAELGHVGSGADYATFGGQGKGFTDPAMVERFVAETGVDALAVAIGTAHGVYKGVPQLDIERLAEIRKRVEIPLVLHGGTGLSTEQFRGAIQGGVSKINVATDMSLAATAAVGAVFKGEKPGLFPILNAIRDAYHERALHYLDVFWAIEKA
jgi:fructose-bisphosphate aldolase class II